MVRKKDVVESGAEMPEGFVNMTDDPQPKRVKERISLSLAPDGSIDWAATRDASKQKFATALSVNPDALRSFGVGKMEVTAPEVGPVTPEHFGMLLSLYEMGERYFIPAYLEKQSKGQVRISPEIAKVAFHFDSDARERYCPLGAQVLNAHLPEWLKVWISKTGPVSELVMGLTASTWMQTRAALEMWKASQPQQAQQEPVAVQ